ncbi:MAG: type II secretion system F family protein [Planctomycetota bacterium]
MSLVKADVAAGADGAESAVHAAVEPFGDISRFHRSLATLCRSDLPMPAALHSLQEELSSSPLREDCATMATEIESGTPFEEAYARRADHFPPIYRALVDAGLRSGDLAGVLDEIAVDASLRARVRDQLRRRLERPMFAALIVFAIGAAMTLLLSPVLNSALPLLPGREARTSPTLMLVLSGLGLLTLLALVVIGYAALRKPIEPAAGPRGIRYQLPLIGRLRSYAAKAGFASTMALLLRRQLPLPQALDLCAATCDGTEVQAQVRRMAQHAHAGAGLAESLRQGNLIPPSLLWFAEAAGSDAASVRALDDIAGIYRQRLTRATDRVAVFALPIIELLIGLVVLAFAMAYVLPAYNVFGIIGL